MAGGATVRAAREGAAGSAGRTESTSDRCGFSMLAGSGAHRAGVRTAAREGTAVPHLPDRPHLHQLRRQARELARAAQAGDARALDRLAPYATAMTLTVAQLVIAREHGFPSWTALKAEVKRRLDPAPTIQPAASQVELAHAFGVIGAQFEPAMTSADRRFGDIDRRFPDDQPMMLVVCNPAVAGGALAFRTRNGEVVLRIIGLAPHLRRRGLGRRLVEQIAREAKAAGSRSVAVGGVTAEERGFYERVGFHGRRSMMRLDL